MSVFNAYMRLSGSVDATIVQDEKLFHHIPYIVSTANQTCDLYIVANDYTALLTTIDVLNSEDVEWSIIGRGTSFLVANQPYHGALIELGSGFKNIEFDPKTGVVHAGAGAKLNHVVMQCATEGVKYLEVLAGIPGTVGGAILTNVVHRFDSAKHWSEIGPRVFVNTPSYIDKFFRPNTLLVKPLSEVVESVIIYDPKSRSLDKIFYSDITKGMVALPENAIVLEATFTTAYVDVPCEVDEVDTEVAKEPSEKHNESVVDYTEYMFRTTVARQPQDVSRCIYPFVAPENDKEYSYAMYIKELFPRGLQVNSVSVDPNYPEYIIGRHGDSSDPYDTIACMRLIQDKVKEVYGVELKSKVRLLGFTS